MRPLWCIRQQPSVPLAIIGDVLDGRGIDWRYVDAWRGDALPDVSQTAGLIVLGGAMNVDAVAEHPWLADVRALLRDVVAAEVPVLGICLGAQLLARAMDAQVVPAAVREAGFRKVEVLPAGASDPLLSCFAPTSMVFQFHEDACELPAGAQLLATGDQTLVQAYRMGSRAYGIQFHLEVTTTQIAAWCDETTPAVLHELWGTSKEVLLAEAQAHLPAQQMAGRRLTAAFLDLPAGRRHAQAGGGPNA